MGLYVQTPERVRKASQIVDEMGGRVVPEPLTLADVPEGDVLLCVVENGPFDAALVVGDEIDFRRARNPRDLRPHTWILVDREKVIANLREQGADDSALAHYGVIPGRSRV